MKLAATIVGSLKVGLDAEMGRIEGAVSIGVKEAGEALNGELRRQLVTAGRVALRCAS